MYRIYNKAPPIKKSADEKISHSPPATNVVSIDVYDIIQLIDKICQASNETF
jgi:hypothetical protein